MPEKGTPSPELTERNRKIYEQKKAGKSYRKLAEDWGLALSRIQSIVAREKKRESERG